MKEDLKTKEALTEQEKLFIQLLVATFEPSQLETITEEGVPPLTVEQFVATYVRSHSAAERVKLYRSLQTERFVTQGIDCLLATAGVAEHARLENTLATTAFVQTEQMFFQLSVPMKRAVRKLRSLGAL